MHQKEYFSKIPFGMIWQNSESGEIYLRYGNVSVCLNSELVDYLLTMANDHSIPRPYCMDCGGVHLDFEQAVVNIEGRDFDHLLVALFHLKRKEHFVDQSLQNNDMNYN